MLAIRGGRPETLTLRDFIEAFIRFPRGSHHAPLQFELLKARERAHILLGWSWQSPTSMRWSS